MPDWQPRRAIGTKVCLCAFHLAVLVCCLAGGMKLSQAQAAEQQKHGNSTNSQVIFVGEDIDTISIASKRDESAWQAPAIGQAIRMDQIKGMGITTLSEVLDYLAGFYVEDNHRGPLPYFRGIRDSVLFLYDTVPMGSRICKAPQPIGHELSIAPIKKVEIVRGPGSVLWGPDAFAGVVNIVPMSGKDLQGAQVGLLAGGPKEYKGFYLNFGHDTENWNGFLSLSAQQRKQDKTHYNLKRFWGEGITPLSWEERGGEGSPDLAEYLDVYGSISLRSRVTISGRIFDTSRPYTLTRLQRDITWPEDRDESGGFVKLEARKPLGLSSGLRLTAYLSSKETDTEVLDKTFDKKEASAYGEVIYDRSFEGGRGVLTVGVSYRKDKVRDVPLWEGFFPDFLGASNVYFSPIISQEDCKTTLWSGFGQYVHKSERFGYWIGLRRDISASYRDRSSYNAGLMWSPSKQWMMKMLFSTAYRTPLARQLLLDNPEPEAIKSLNARIDWRPSSGVHLSLTGFVNRIKHHIIEDPYAGLSLPSAHTLSGVELEGKLSPSASLDLSANLTLLDHGGDEERFRFLESIIVTPNGNIVKHYIETATPYNKGPGKLANIMASWRPARWVDANIRLRYICSRKVAFPKAASLRRLGGLWLTDLSATVHNVLIADSELTVRADNLFNRHYHVPGLYSVIEGEPLTLTVMFTKKW